MPKLGGIGVGGDEVLGPMTMQCLLACDIVKVSWYFNIYYKLA